MNVYDEAMKRYEIIFNDFENVLVAFSCGKDSGVMLSLAYKYAKENNMLHKLAVYYQDYEAGYRHTDEYAERVFKDLDIDRKYWICLPISAACSVSMYEPRWTPWDKDKKEIWVRDMPDYDYVVNEENCPFPFTKGTKGFDMRIDFSRWFGSEYGKTAVLVGIRADESLTRRGIFTSKHRKHMHKGLRYSKIVDENTINFYPIWDWNTEDIWIANHKFEFDYNKIYDLYYQAGLTIDQMRVASPFHLSGQENLKLYKVIDPNNWGKMVGRVNGCNFGGIYGGTKAMGWRSITKPEHFTWKQYAEFLMDTLPGNIKKKFTHHLDRYKKTWTDRGYGRNPRVIKEIIDSGVDIEVTDKISKLCTKDDVYRIIKMKGDWPDEINITGATPFRHCPNWKAVCVTIMKNDFGLTYMSCGRTKDKQILKEGGMSKYKNLKNISKDLKTKKIK
jgi:predicted phosphoadenosine phosphosulfate sulfurtransferase